MPPALTAEQLAIYRVHPQAANAYLWLDRPPIVYQAQVNLPSGALYPVTSVVTDNVIAGNIANVEEGMLVAFGTSPGKSDLGRTVIKSTSGGAVLHFPRTSNGKVDGTVDLIDNTYVSVFDHYPVWAHHPYNIQGTDTFYKYSDWDFATYGALLLPICNIGMGHIYADVVGAGDTITLSLDSSSSFSPQGVAISSRLWNVKDGTITVGTTTTAAITATFPVGRRWITCTVTDANGKTRLRRLLVVACKDGTAYEALTAFSLSGPLRHTVEGQVLSFEVFQDIAEADYVDGAAICYFVHEVYGDAEATLNSSVVKFSGWHHHESANIEARPTYLRRKTKIDAIDTAGKLAALPGFPQVVEGAAPPTRWEEMSSPNGDKYLAYLWLYHSHASMLADFQWSGVGASYPFTRLGSNGGSLWEQLDGRARAIGGYYRLLSDALGRVRVKLDPLTQEVADRTATNTIDLAEDDWATLGWTGQRPPRSHWLNGGAIIASAGSVNPTFVIAPGLTPGQGTSENNLGEMLVLNQTKLSQVCGQQFLRENAPQSYFRIRLLHGGDASYEPLDFVRLTMSSETAAQRGLSFTNERFLIVEVETDYDNATGQQVKSLVLERETKGNAAFPLAPILETDTGYTEPSSYFQSDFAITDPIPLPGGTAFAATLDRLAYTTNRSAASPAWTAIAKPGGVTGFRYVLLDPFSPRFVSGSGAVRAWLLDDSGNLYYTASLLTAAPTWALKATLSKVPTHVIMRADSHHEGELVVGWNSTAAPGHSHHCRRYTSFGASVKWAYDAPQASQHIGDGLGLDIDSYGADEVWFTVRHENLGAYSIELMRISNGVTTMAFRFGTTVWHNAVWIQKPLKRFTGGNNSGLGGAAHLLAVISPGGPLIQKSVNGGASWTTIGQGPALTGMDKSQPPWWSSCCFTEDPNVIVAGDIDGDYHTTENLGGSWTNYGFTNYSQFTMGFYPVKVSGSYTLFGGGVEPGYSEDFGLTWQSAVGDWAAAVGGTMLFIHFIPLG